MKKHSAVACISRADLFSSLSPDALKKIAAITTHQEYFPRNTIIRQPGDGKEGMIFMDEGSAKIYSLNEDGKETVLGVINKGDYAGQQSLFKEPNHENYTMPISILLGIILAFFGLKNQTELHP